MRNSGGNLIIKIGAGVFVWIKGDAMRSMTTCAAAAIVAALCVGAITGCGNQSAPSEGTAVDGVAELASEQPQDALVAEYRDAVAKVPAYQSVTIVETTESVFFGVPSVVVDGATSTSDTGEGDTARAGTSDEGGTEDITFTNTTTYMFDASGSTLKTSMIGEVGDAKVQYLTDGDDVACVTDGPVYSGTTKQFDLPQSDGVEVFLERTIGDLSALADCVSSVDKSNAHGLTLYTLTLDPEAYVASDKILSVKAETGNAVEEAVFVVGFNEDGSIASIDKRLAYKNLTSAWNLVFSDYDRTVIPALPEADRTYEDMGADAHAKYEKMAGGLEEAGGE